MLETRIYLLTRLAHRMPFTTNRCSIISHRWGHPLTMSTHRCLILQVMTVAQEESHKVRMYGVKDPVLDHLVEGSEAMVQ
jgi:hypothetical protein